MAKSPLEKKEEAIAEILEQLSAFSKGFTAPRLILIGGYALRAYTELSRYTRDCDFATQVPCLKQIQDALGLTAEAFFEDAEHGYIRLLRLLRLGKTQLKLSIDVMQGEIRGRIPEDRIVLDESFVQNSLQTTLPVGTRRIAFFTPSYTDYLLMKIASARQSDIRDVATLIWKRGISEDFLMRAKQIYTPSLIPGKVIGIIETISHPRFVDSWRGTFVTRTFEEADKKAVIAQLQALI